MAIRLLVQLETRPSNNIQKFTYIYSVSKSCYKRIDGAWKEFFDVLKAADLKLFWFPLNYFSEIKESCNPTQLKQ